MQDGDVHFVQATVAANPAGFQPERHFRVGVQGKCTPN